MVCDISPSRDAFPHQIWNSYLKECRRYAQDSKQFLEIRSEAKVNVTGTQGWCATLCHLSMHSHTKIGIPISNNIGDMHQTGSGMGGLMDGQTGRGMDKANTICSPQFFGGIKQFC